MVNKNAILKLIVVTIGSFLFYLGFLKIRNYLPYNFGYQISRIKSVNCDVFLYKKRNFIVKRGDLVLFRVKGYGRLHDLTDNLILLKRIGALPGDYIYCDPSLFKKCSINGEEIGPEVPDSLFPNFRQTIGFVPPGMFAPFGDYVRSYDTRLSGLVPMRTIVGKVLYCLVKEKE